MSRQYIDSSRILLYLLYHLYSTVEKVVGLFGEMVANARHKGGHEFILSEYGIFSSVNNEIYPVIDLNVHPSKPVGEYSISTYLYALVAQSLVYLDSSFAAPLHFSSSLSSRKR